MWNQNTECDACPLADLCSHYDQTVGFNECDGVYDCTDLDDEISVDVNSMVDGIYYLSEDEVYIEVVGCDRENEFSDDEPEEYWLEFSWYRYVDNC